MTLSLSEVDEARKGRLDDWRESIRDDADKLLPWLIDEDDGSLMELLALCAAQSLNAATASVQARAADAIAEAVGLDMAAW